MRYDGLTQVSLPISYNKVAGVCRTRQSSPKDIVTASTRTTEARCTITTLYYYSFADMKDCFIIIGY